MIKKIVTPVIIMATLILTTGCTTLPPQDKTIAAIEKKSSLKAVESDVNIDFIAKELNGKNVPITAKVTGNIKVVEKEETEIAANLDFDLGFIKSNFEYYITNNQVIYKSQYDQKYKIKNLDSFKKENFDNIIKKIQTRKDLITKVSTDWIKSFSKERFQEEKEIKKLILDNEVKELKVISLSINKDDLKRLVDGYLNLLTHPEIKEIVYKEVIKERPMEKDQFEKEYNKKINELIEKVNKGYEQFAPMIKDDQIVINYGIDKNNMIWTEQYNINFILNKNNRDTEVKLNILSKYLGFDDKVKLVLPIFNKENSMTITR